jgi:hypothetical protein
LSMRPCFKLSISLQFILVKTAPNNERVGSILELLPIG